MQILADANSSPNRSAPRNWTYPKAVDIKMRRPAYCRLLTPCPPAIQDQRTRARNGFWVLARICFPFIRVSVLISAREIPRVYVRARAARPAASGDANLVGNVPSLIKNRGEMEREQENRRRRCSRASPLHSARRQTRAECARRAYFHQFRMSRGTARSYFIDDLSARRRARKRERAVHAGSCILGTKSRKRVRTARVCIRRARNPGAYHEKFYREEILEEILLKGGWGGWTTNHSRHGLSFPNFPRTGKCSSSSEYRRVCRSACFHSSEKTSKRFHPPSQKSPPAPSCPFPRRRNNHLLSRQVITTAGLCYEVTEIRLCLKISRPFSHKLSRFISQRISPFSPRSRKTYHKAPFPPRLLYPCRP